MARRSPALRLPATRDQRALIDLCYRLDLDDAAFIAEAGAWWQQRGPDGPMGAVVSSTYRDNAAQFRFDLPWYGRAETLAAMRRIFTTTTKQFKAALIGARPAFTCASSFPHSEEGLRESRRFGVADMAAILSPTGTGHVIMIGTPVGRRALTSVAQRAAMSVCASHLAASWRLRRRLHAEDRWEGRAEAVMHPDGRVVHAVGEARAPGALAALRRMVRATERARSGPRADDEPPWPDLVAGRWTLVDAFDHGGRRYVVAYRNPPDAPRTPLSLRAQEVLTRTARGEPSKVIAAALGVGEAAVSMTLHEAMRVMRIERVADLIRLGAEAPPEVVFRDEALTALALAPAGRLALDALTAAEREVFTELVRGRSNRAIAAVRNRSERTVANQVASVFAKLGVDSRRGLLAKIAGR